MKILQFSDIHSTTSGIKIIQDDIKKADLILLSGDITHFGHRENAIEVIDNFTELNKNVLAITGNCDYDDVYEYLKKTEYNLDKEVKEIEGYNFIGLGGSLITPFRTPNEFTEEYYQKILEKISKGIQNQKPVILLSHQPPYKTKLDKVSIINHVGSKSIRSFIEKQQPILCLCGHIHEAIGIDKIGNTRIVNPGSFRNGKYAEIKINKENIEIYLKSL